MAHRSGGSSLTDPWTHQPERVGFLCRHCGTHTQGKLLAVHRYREVVDDHAHGPDYRYRLVECSQCFDVSLLISMEILSDFFDDEVPLYPPQPKHLAESVPEGLRACLEEARACLSARAYTASVIMYRRALELLAVDRGVKVRNLAVALKKLQEQHEIDQRLYEWADELRLAGNHAAHKVHDGVSPVDAKDINDLTEAIIDYVYVFQARYEAFKARRGQTPAEET